MWLNKKKMKISGFRVFDLALRTKLKSRKSRKVFTRFKFASIASFLLCLVPES